MGLGHMRRNLLVSEALGRGPSPAHVLLIAGAPELGAFLLPPHVDAVMLPPFVKTTHSGYVVTVDAGSADPGPQDCNGNATAIGYYVTASPLSVGLTGQRAFSTSCPLFAGMIRSSMPIDRPDRVA